MVPVRRKIELQDGVTAEMLFTPHLFSYKGHKGLELDANAENPVELSMYFADLMYAAALNSWEIDEGRNIDEAPFRRGDFHALITGSRQEFRVVIDFALRALTGKTPAELAADAKSAGDDAGDGKKKRSASTTDR